MKEQKEKLAFEIKTKVKELNKLIAESDKNGLEIFLQFAPVLEPRTNDSRKLLEPIIQERIIY